MPKPPINLDTYLKYIPSHSIPLSQESGVPAEHYRRSANDAWNLLVYVERNLSEVSVYRASYERHIRRLSTMVLLGLVESFERFLKEIAAECINHIAGYVVDGRFDVFTAKGSAVAMQFAERNLGKALCEALTWCDCDETNKRIRRILADPFDAGSFYVFPLANQDPIVLRDRYELMCLIWQLRHTIAHNAAVVTGSDALKLRLLIQRAVDSPRLLWPTKGDVWYVKLFLDETAGLINREVSQRLAVLLSTVHNKDNTLFAPNAKAQELANLFRLPCTVAGQTCNPA
ncbi:MAG: hypothetical protein WD847_17590 [Pirellulales bacterium]